MSLCVLHRLHRYAVKSNHKADKISFCVCVFVSVIHFGLIVCCMLLLCLLEICLKKLLTKQTKLTHSNNIFLRGLIHLTKSYGGGLKGIADEHILTGIQIKK